MKYTPLCLPLLCVFVSCSPSSRIGESEVKFPECALVNDVEFMGSDKAWDQIGCGFLFLHEGNIYAVTAKHILSIVAPKDLNVLQLQGSLKQWSMRSLNQTSGKVVMGRLLNENPEELLRPKAPYRDDWLIFEIESNTTSTKPLEIRSTPLVHKERLYVVGWTRHQKEGPQRVYEFEYKKSKENRLLCRELLVPEKKGGLSGAPVVDADGKLVGVVSNSTFDLWSMGRLFSPVDARGIETFFRSSNPESEGKL